VRARSICAVELAVQAEGAEQYQPLVTVDGQRTWPEQPLKENLGRLATGDLEADACDALERITWEHGRDFDAVVLAIPATCHRRIAAELMEASPRYRTMVENAHGVRTIAAQAWLTRSPGELEGGGTAAAVTTGWSGLFRTWADMSAIIDAEPWEPPRPAGLAYFCSVAPPELQVETDRGRSAEAVKGRLEAWAASDLREHWPRFDESALHGGWDGVYARANVAEWEQYMLSLPGTTRHRLAPDDSTFDNLWLAGDWTQNLINGGSVEGAVSSGVAAAAAISAVPV
jgi:hypothetical protein